MRNLLLPLALLALAAACASSSPGSSSGAAPTFTTLYTTIISKQEGARLACIECHNPPPGFFDGSLDMSTQAKAYANLVGVAAAGPKCGTSGQKRVVAGNSGASLLFHKVQGTQTCGDRMPLGGPYITDAEVAMFQAWIDAGAQNN
jgi:hypothetical protein